MSSDGSEKNSSSSENYIAIRCAGCNKRLKIPPKMAGRTINCPVCKASVAVPVLDPIDIAASSAPTIEESKEKLAAPIVSSQIDSETSNSSAIPALVNDQLMDDDDLYKLASEDSPTARDSKVPATAMKSDVLTKTQAGSLTDELDDDFFKLAEESPVKKPSNAGLKIPGLALDDLDLSEINKPAATPIASSSSSTSKNTKSQTAQTKPATEKRVDSKGDLDFRFPCKVCGSLVNANTSQIGGNIRCPGCYSEFTVPSPSAERSKRPTSAAPNSGDAKGASGNDTKQNSGRTATSRTAEQLLARAAQEIETRDSKEEEDSFDFGSASWSERTFYFLKDSSAVVILISTGVFMGGVLVGADSAGQMLKSYSESGYFFGLMIVFVLMGLPILSMTLANGLALLEATANRLKKVASWPAFSPFEALNEVALVVAACALAGVPGGILGYVAPMLGLPPQITVGLILLSGWLLLPIVLIGMLDNQSVTEPVSMPVIHSIESRSNAWTTMYGSTGIVLVLLFAMYLVYTIGTFVARFALGLSIPFAIFFIFHQYGLLAIQIGDVTSLPFSDQSDEDEEAEDADESTQSQE